MAVIPVGDGPVGVTVSGGMVWVANTYSGNVKRIDPRTGRVVRTVATGDRPVDVAGRGDALWVAVAPSAASHRGGTLRIVASPGKAESFDPGFLGRYDSNRLVIMTSDGLTALRKVGGAEGTTLVPDLATALPTPTDSGRTYTFTLRTGIRYSNGARVRPRDFRRALERVLAGQSANASWFAGIVGAAGCAEGRRQCDLSRGIVTDDATRTVAFHLREPDAEFPHKLALTAAFPVPASTPWRNLKTTHPIPGTGPYKIARYTPGREVAYVRNPYFREWSRAAQPAGFPDRIVIRSGLGLDAQLDAIEQGRADATIYWPSAYRVDEVATRHPDLLHANPIAGVEGIFMNMVPPFDDVRVRRALALAIDRPRLLAILGGSQVWRPSCQVQPQNFPGYERYCPLGHDLATAKRLVRASGTTGMRVQFWVANYRPFPAVGRYVTKTLRQLGYDASAEVRSFAKFGKRVGNYKAPVQLSFNGFITDYPVASDFLKGLSCQANRASPFAFSTGFCDPAVEAAITEALRVQVTSPQAANRLWAKVDRLVVDRAPSIPIANGKWIDVVSKRVGNYQYHPQYAMLFDQAWVR